MTGQHVSGLLHTVLSLRQPGALLVFRAALRHVVRQRLHILEGSPPLAAEQHKARCMQVFFSHSTTKLWQQMIFSTLPNGDWRKEDVVEFYKGPRDSRSAVEIATLLESGLCLALVGHKPRLYAAHRWTGAELSIDELMRLQCIHGLLKHTYLEFLHRTSKAEPKAGRAGRQGGPRGPHVGAQSVVRVAGGTLSYYAAGDFFEAVCSHHDKCKLRRSARGQTTKAGLVAGRPLGFLMQWLSQGPLMASKEAHWDKAVWASWSQEARQDQRRSLSEQPLGPELIAFERPKAADEDEEPSSLKGYLR